MGPKHLIDGGPPSAYGCPIGTAKGSRCESGAAPATVTGDVPFTLPLVGLIHGLTNWEGERARLIREPGDLPF